MVELIGIVSGVIGVTLALVVVLRKREMARPNLQFNLGICRAQNRSDFNRAQRKLLRKLPTTSLLYAIRSSLTRDPVLHVPFLLQNRGKLPIRNLVLRLQYPAIFFSGNDEFLLENTADICAEDHEMHLDLKRNMQHIGTHVSVDVPIEILRPGEKVIAGEWLRFSMDSGDLRTEAEEMDSNSGLPSAVWRLDKLVTACTIHVQLLSEDLPADVRTCRLLLLRTDTEPEFEEHSLQLVKAFWNNKLPKPGVYWIPKFVFRMPKGQGLGQDELFEVVCPKLALARGGVGEVVSIEIPQASQRTIMRVSVPPWLAQKPMRFVQRTEDLEEVFYAKRLSSLLQKRRAKRNAKKKQHESDVQIEDQ